MSGPMSHPEADELLSAYALDAVDGAERADLEAHLASCPRCRAELDELREVAAAVGTTVERPPEGLWTQIAGSLGEGRDHSGPTPMPRLSQPAADLHRAADAPASPGAPHRARRTPVLLGALAVAAAVVALVLGLSLAHADDRISGLQSATGAPGSVAAALTAPGHRVVALRTTSATQVARVILLPDGRGYVDASGLPSLGADRTYQLWGIVGKTPISLGLLGAAPRQAAFTMAGARRASTFGITVEPAGGSVAPTLPIVASGTV